MFVPQKVGIQNDIIVNLWEEYRQSHSRMVLDPVDEVFPSHFVKVLLPSSAGAPAPAHLKIPHFDHFRPVTDLKKSRFIYWN